MRRTCLWERLLNRIDARILQSALNGTNGLCSGGGTGGMGHNGAAAVHFGLVGTLLVAGIMGLFITVLA